MRIDVISLFPHLVDEYFQASVLGIAQKKSLYSLYTHNPRKFSLDKHQSVDDTPYGGGAGMLLMPQPFFDCLENVLDDIKTQDASALVGLETSSMKVAELNHPQTRDYEIIITSPCGERWNQELARDFSCRKNLIIFCGRYEGFDERIKNIATKKISLGDFVLTGGEVPAIALVDSVLRLLPGVLGDDTSSYFESFSELDYLTELKKIGVTKRELQELLDKTGLKLDDLRQLNLLEYPQYTRPANFRGQEVPKVLQRGNHQEIFLWRLKASLRTLRKS
jgi:tRNA (guanine37-N1)-methyltransferase